ncbi:hypothetical protein GTW38_23675 [Streptomyces sp. SID7804]|nr:MULTISPECIES: hypothetical protein [Streptomyces]MBA8974052.1 hypothetical protein [Streptomyces calvus]MYS29861.1 hypothetical protein [Streptomyces sp. SID7804]
MPLTIRRLATRLLPALCVVALCVVATALTTAPAAQAQPAPGTRSTSPFSTQAAYLADRLRDHPVHVTDQLPRAVPRSLAPDFARLAQRTGVPTYVLVLPAPYTDGDELLGAVHERLDRDGLYVLVDDSEVIAARSFGVRAPAEAAARAARFELPYDAGALRSFERFVEIVSDDAENAEARASAASAAYRDGAPEQMYIGPSDRRNQSFLTGIALTGVPLSILLLVPYARRRLSAGPPAAGRKKKKSKSSAPAPARPLLHRLALPAAALATAVAIGAGAPLLFDETRSSAAPTPTPADLSARVERVSAGLTRDPVYQDPESPQRLDAAQLARLHERIDRFRRSEGGGPVFVTLVPHSSEDESAGDEELFSAAVHARLDKDGVYVAADPVSGFIDVFNHGLRLDSYDLLFDLPESITYGSEKAYDDEDHLLAERLDALMTYLDEAPRTEEPNSSGSPAQAPNPAKEHTLPPLFATDFWPGLFVGGFAALLLLCLVAGAWRTVSAVRRRLGLTLLPVEPGTAPTSPSEAYLRRTARAELRAAQSAVQAAAPSPPPTAQDRYEAALLLAGTDSARLRDSRTPTAYLLAVTVLARATRAALEGDNTARCCAVNPLHGAAATRRHIRVADNAATRRFLPVCALCRDTATAAPGDLPRQFLTLPRPSGTRVRYDEPADGLLSTLSSGYAALVTKVRESASTG